MLGRRTCSNESRRSSRAALIAMPVTAAAEATIAATVTQKYHLRTMRSSAGLSAGADGRFVTGAVFFFAPHVASSSSRCVDAGSVFTRPRAWHLRSA